MLIKCQCMKAVLNVRVKIGIMEAKLLVRTLDIEVASIRIS